MARHRSDSPPTGGVPRQPRHTPAGGIPTAGVPEGRTDGAARHRSDPDTTPLDLAAIAVAAATARLRVADEDRTAPPATPAPRTPSDPLPAPVASPTTSEAPAHTAVAQAPVAHTSMAHTSMAPAAVATGSEPATGSHRAPARAMLGRVLRPTRAASALALVGAIAGAGVAAAGGGTVLAGPEPAADTGELSLPSTDPTVTGEQVAPAGVQSSTRSVAAPPTRATTPSSTPKTTKPRASAAPAPAARPASDGRTLWSADFANAGLDNFKSTPWNNQGAKAPTMSGGLASFLMPGGGKRSEIEPDFKSLEEGDEYYFGFTVTLADDFPVDTSDWQVITQFKNDGTGSPPLEVKVQDGQFLLDGGSGAFSEVIGEAKPGQTTHLALKVKFSSSDGRVSAWQDGAKKITDFAPPGGTLYEGKSSYVKTGIYRDTSIDQAGKLSFGSWAIGTGLGAVGDNARAGAAKD